MPTSSTPEILSRNPSWSMNPSNSVQNLMIQSQQQQQQFGSSSSRPTLPPPQVLDINNESSNGSSGYIQQQNFNQNQNSLQQGQEYVKPSGYIFSQQQQKQSQNLNKNMQQMNKDLRNKSQSFTLSDYYNQAGVAFNGPRPTTPQSVVQNISNAGHGRADTPASSQFNQQQRISITGEQNNREISLMSTIRALNNQLQKIDQGEKKNAYGIEDPNSGIIKSSSQQNFNNNSMHQGGQGISQLSNSVKQGLEDARKNQQQMTNSEQRRELQKKQTPHFVNNSTTSNEMNLQDELDQNYSHKNKNNQKESKNQGVRLTRVDFADQVIDDISDRKTIDSRRMIRDLSERNLLNEIRDVQKMITSQSTKNFRGGSSNNEGISFPYSIAAGTDPQQSKSPASQPGSGKQKFQIAIAIYDFKAQREGDLSFKQGQQILILQKKQQHNWWLGTMGHNKEGWFPKNFVKVEPLIPNE